MARPTLDTRSSLYGERRMSDPQVRMLRQLQDGRASVRHDATFYALLDQMLLRGGAPSSSGVIAEITERGRAILTAIDKSNGTKGA